MPATRRESSADSAARFLAARGSKPAPYRRAANAASYVPPSRPLVASCCGFRRQARNLVSRDGLLVCAPAKGCAGRSGPRRIACDFAEPTLRAIHKVLCDAMAPREHRPEHYTGELLNLIVIAEQMVGRSLGYPDCDDPPLTDREASR